MLASLRAKAAALLASPGLSPLTRAQYRLQSEWLVGDVFLKNAYFSVDVGKNAISLAKLV